MPESGIDKRALYGCTYGVYVITSRDGDRRNGQIANTVFQVTSEPPRIAVAINKENYTHELIANSSMLAVSVLEESTPVGFIGRLGFRSGRDHDKLADVEFEDGASGMPRVTQHSLSCFEGKVLNSMDTGTHTLFLAELTSAKVLREGNPLTYADYRAMKGKAPKSAPLSEPDEIGTEKKGDSKMKKYVCQVCGYVYDPDDGDPDSDIPPGTPFEDLTDDWVCPVCGASKDQFEPE